MLQTQQAVPLCAGRTHAGPLRSRGQAASAILAGLLVLLVHYWLVTSLAWRCHYDDVQMQRRRSLPRHVFWMDSRAQHFPPFGPFVGASASSKQSSGCLPAELTLPRHIHTWRNDIAAAVFQQVKACMARDYLSASRAGTTWVKQQRRRGLPPGSHHYNNVILPRRVRRPVCSAGGTIRATDRLGRSLAAAVARPRLPVAAAGRA